MAVPLRRSNRTRCQSRSETKPEADAPALQGHFPQIGCAGVGPEAGNFQYVADRGSAEQAGYGGRVQCDYWVSGEVCRGAIPPEPSPNDPDGRGVGRSCGRHP